MLVTINHKTLGRLIQGSCEDVSRKPFEQKLKQFDPLLYVKWNPKKRNGLGMWEIRRRPESQTAVFWSEHQGSKFFKLEYVESDLIHHVLDVERLNYGILDRLYEMDTWKIQDFAGDLDYREAREQERLRSQSKSELRYQIKHNKKAFEYALDAYRSGRNPAKLFI